MNIPFLGRIKQAFAPASNDDVTNKQYVDGVAATKANTSHTHTIANVTNLQTALDGKASTDYVDDAVAEAAASSAVESTWLYPNGGTAEAPANVSMDSRYVLPNPWPGYFVKCSAQVLYAGVWGSPGWSGGVYSQRVGSGVRASLHDGNFIVVQTGDHGLLVKDGSSGGTFGLTLSGFITTPLPCRVYVEKGGIMP